MSTAESEWLTETVTPGVRDFYTALGLVLPDRGGAEAAIRCFANAAGHSHDDRKPSCSVNLLTGLWHCAGCGASGNPYAAAIVMGRSEDQARDLAKSYGLFLEGAKTPGERPKVKLPGERDFKKWWRALRSSEAHLARLQEVKGWTPEAVQRLGLGWDGERVVFPIRNERLKIVGCVRYLPGGKPKSLADRGSKRLLFPSPEFLPRKQPVLIVEGEPDAVAVWSCGFRGVAVPGAGSWQQRWSSRLVGRQVIVVPDCDRQGRELAQRIARDVPRARVVELDAARDDGWDIGDVVREAHAEGGLWQARLVLEGMIA